MSSLVPLPGSLQPSTVSSARRRLSTDAVSGPERLDYWVDMISAMYVQLECEPPRDRVLFGDIEFSRIGSLDLTLLKSNASRVWRATSRIHDDSDDCCMIQLQRSGRGTILQDGRAAAVGPGDFALYGCGRPYELRFDDDHHEVIVLRVPRAQLEPHVGNLSELTATAVSGSGAAGHLLLSMVETLRRDIDQLHPSSAVGVSEAIINIIAAGLRSLPGANARKASNLHAYHVARVKAFVLQQLRNPELSVATVAQAMKLSSDHLSRLFRTESVPLSRLIWQQRLDACRRDLVDPRLAERGVSEIAFSWGFNEAAHFSRTFREQFGVSPREWRQRTFDAIGSPEIPPRV
jgi:AraC-like DNA-binding protein